MTFMRRLWVALLMVVGAVAWVAPTRASAAVPAYAGAATGLFTVCEGYFGPCSDLLGGYAAQGAQTVRLKIVLAASNPVAASTQAYDCWNEAWANNTLHCEQLTQSLEGITLPGVGQLPPSFDVLPITLSLSPTVSGYPLQVPSPTDLSTNTGPQASTWAVEGTVSTGPLVGDVLACAGAGIGKWYSHYAPYGRSYGADQDVVAGACTLG